MRLSKIQLDLQRRCVYTAPDGAQAASSTLRSGARTLSEELRERIEEEIATGAFGSRHSTGRIRAGGAVWRLPDPIREALFQLASMGILQVRPHRGAIVPEVSLHRLVEMFEVMADLEALCGRPGGAAYVGG